MRSWLLAFTLLAMATQADAAQKVVFPYDASIEVDETDVRSGPGSKYYPTARLKLGQRVVVHRHDPGGWHMIAPPAGSFSWVQGRYVDKTADGRGTVNTNHVVAWVGSNESDIREIYQQKLAEGDEVQILSEKQLSPTSGTGPSELWYRIAPRRGEWRWISGQALSPPRRESGKATDDPFDKPLEVGSRGRGAPAAATVDDERFEKPVSRSNARDYLDNDRFSPPSSAGTRESGAIADRPVVRRQGHGSPAKQAEAAIPKQLDAQLEELDRLDARFRSILEQDPLEWDFTQLDRDYRSLRAEIESSNVQQMIDVRLARMDNYRKTRAEHEELARISQETLKRDAELAEIQRRHEAQLTALRQPRFDGAGIVERAALNRRGAPQHVLLAPSRKVLAYLVAAPGVNLDAWLGRSVGVSGSRVPHPDLKADLITVFRLSPVRLAQ